MLSFFVGLPSPRLRGLFFWLCTGNNKEFDRQNQVALSERLGAGLRRKGCDAYLNGTRAFREVQRCPNEPLKAARRAAPQSERETKKTRLRAKFLAQNCYAPTNKRQQRNAVVFCRLAFLSACPRPACAVILGLGSSPMDSVPQRRAPTKKFRQQKAVGYFYVGLSKCVRRGLFCGLVL